MLRTSSSFLGVRFYTVLVVDLSLTLISFTARPLVKASAPFFIAALAVVSTFAGPELFSEPFKMKEPVTLHVIGERGEPELKDVTPRHFLSLLLGYCCLLSLVPFLVSIFSPVFVGAAPSQPDWYENTVTIGFLFGFMFLFSRWWFAQYWQFTS